jgi:type I restriction enzyme S subunit
MKDWIEVKLGSLFEVNVGGDLRSECFSVKADEVYTFPVYSNSLENQGLYGFTSKPRHPANSITITGRGFLGHAEYRDIDFDAIVRLLVLTPKQNVDCRFIAYLINGRINFAIESTGVPQLTAPKIVKTKVLIPERVAEQTAIATILSKVDEAIAATQNSIKAAERLKKALMQNLLTGKLKPDGSWRTEDEFYEDEKVGKVPKGWEVKKLKDVSDEIIMGQSPSSDSYNDFVKGLPFVQGNADFKNKEIKIRTFTDDPKKISTKNDILITVRAPVGDIYKNTLEKIAIGRGISAISIKNKSLNSFVSYTLQWDKKQFLKLEQGTTFTEIGKREVRNLVVKVPPENEREKLIEKISSISIENSKKQTKIQTLQRLKKSLMQNLLTGKVRLPQEFIAQFEEVEETIKS